jgi:hypothetical protein
VYIFVYILSQKDIQTKKKEKKEKKRKKKEKKRKKRKKGKKTTMHFEDAKPIQMSREAKFNDIRELLGDDGTRALAAIMLMVVAHGFALGLLGALRMFDAEGARWYGKFVKKHADYLASVIHLFVGVYFFTLITMTIFAVAIYRIYTTNPAGVDRVITKIPQVVRILFS